MDYITKPPANPDAEPNFKVGDYVHVKTYDFALARVHSRNFNANTGRWQYAVVEVQNGAPFALRHGIGCFVEWALEAAE